MTEADGFSLLYRVLLVALALVEFFVPLPPLGHRPLFEWAISTADVWFVEHVSPDAALELIPPIAAGIGVIFVSWLVVSAFVGILRSVFQGEH
jgi:hypothetical protein